MQLAKQALSRDSGSTSEVFSFLSPGWENWFHEDSAGLMQRSGLLFLKEWIMLATG